ncbi:MAG: peroxiredoxin [Hyphomicrobiaceae bacterium]
MALEDDGRAGHLVPGMPMPAIALPSTSGGDVDLSAVHGRAVVFCYPWTGRPGLPNPPNWDDIPGAHGSTPQAIGFRDCYPEFRARNVAVFGLSSQTTAYQQELSDRLALPYALLCDVGFAFQKALALPTFETGGTTYLTRLTLIVEDGALRDCLYPVDPPEGNAAATRERLDEYELFTRMI